MSMQGHFQTNTSCLSEVKIVTTFPLFQCSLRVHNQHLGCILNPDWWHSNSTGISDIQQWQPSESERMRSKRVPRGGRHDRSPNWWQLFVEFADLLSIYLCLLVDMAFSFPDDLWGCWLVVEIHHVVASSLLSKFFIWNTLSLFFKRNDLFTHLWIVSSKDIYRRCVVWCACALY